MRLNFQGSLLKQSNRHFIEIPFNLWDLTEIKGQVPVQASIDGIDFECKLTPKGNGHYYLPVKKDILNKVSSADSYTISLVIIKQLTRINNNSPYSIDNPIRIIDSIQFVDSTPGYCGQCVIAMLTGEPIEAVTSVMKAKKSQASLSKIVESLDYYGIAHSNKMTYKVSELSDLPNCCIINNRGRYLLYYSGMFYVPSEGVSNTFPVGDITGYLEISISN